MEKITQHNFDWNITNKDIVIFVPNFKRKNLLISTLERFQTKVPRDKWLILVVNDGIHEDLSDLADQYNIAYFTLERDVVQERNGCMARNYVIKRIQSRIFASRDPEIILHCDDYITTVMQLTSKQIHRCHYAAEMTEQDRPRILADPNLDVTKLPTLRVWPVQNIHTYQGFHFCFATYTDLLRQIGGYDEDYENGYGYEDIDLLERLIIAGGEFIVDKNFSTYHIWHPHMRRFHRTITSNENLFRKKMAIKNPIANEGIVWGEN